MNGPFKQPFPGVCFTQISADEAGQRIDNYLIHRFKNVPRSHIYRILRKGEVRVNKKRIRPMYKLAVGDKVRMPPVRTGEKINCRPPDTVIRRLASRIVHEDSRLIVVNKPAGLAVHAGTNVDFGVIDVMRCIDGSAKELFLVHRLDRDTSGCLLIARDRSALRDLQSALQNNAISKHYMALVKGHWGSRESKIDMPLRRDKIQAGERLVQAGEGGKQAVSVFKAVREFAHPAVSAGCSLMKVQLITGRTHQLRVHGAESGHPLAGDRRYGDKEFNRQMKMMGLMRMFLHASSLAFPHPDNGKVMQIEPPLDDELQRTLDRLAT